MATLAASVLTACNSGENDVVDKGRPKPRLPTALTDRRIPPYDQTMEAGYAIGISGTSGSKASPDVRFLFVPRWQSPCWPSEKAMA